MRPGRSSLADSAALITQETVARLQTQVDDATSQRERSVAALRDELRVARTKLETRRRKGPAAQTAAKRLAEAEAVEAAAMAAQVKLGWRLRQYVDERGVPQLATPASRVAQLTLSSTPHSGGAGGSLRTRREPEA